MPPLHRLPNGDWIELCSVSGIAPADAYSSYPTPSVRVVCGNEHHVIPFDTFGEAVVFADRLGVQVNEVKIRIDPKPGGDVHLRAAAQDLVDALRAGHLVFPDTTQKAYNALATMLTTSPQANVS